jgi:hypothetical protein
MSRLRFNSLAADPAAPAAGKVELYTRTSDKKLRTIDEAGLVRVMLEEAATLYRLIKVTAIFQGTTSYTPPRGRGRALRRVHRRGRRRRRRPDRGHKQRRRRRRRSGRLLVQVDDDDQDVHRRGRCGRHRGRGRREQRQRRRRHHVRLAVDLHCERRRRRPPRHRRGRPKGRWPRRRRRRGRFRGRRPDRRRRPGDHGLALAAAQAVSGDGGPAAFNGNAPGIKTQGNGTVGGNYGGGGSGGVILSGGASVAGGAGGNGVIRVWEFQSIT